MNDIAAAAGVGLKTVSRVVNGESRVSPETAAKMHEAIVRLGFRRNESARTLRQGHTASIGLVLEDVADPFYSSLTRAVEEVAREHGCLVFTGSSDEDPARERDVTLAFCARNVDGLLVVPAGEDHSYLATELAAGMAAVFVDRPATGIDCDAVLVDNAGGAMRAAEHLLRQGHRRIAYLGDSATIYTARERLRGYREALEAAGMAYDDSLVFRASPTEHGVRMMLDRALGADPPATAVVTGNNRISTAVLRALVGRPRRPALVGFDDSELADLLTPGHRRPGSGRHRPDGGPAALRATVGRPPPSRAGGPRDLADPPRLRRDQPQSPNDHEPPAGNEARRTLSP
jgi:LacI family transcriptional regulator